MKTIIAGSRKGFIRDEVFKVLNEHTGFPITEVVCGLAEGPDKFGRDWALTKKIPVKYFPAMWNTHGAKAGHIRNYEMAQYAEALIAFWDGKSKGTESMIKMAEKKGIPVFVIRH